MLPTLIVVACYLIGAAWLATSAYRAQSTLGGGGRLAGLCIAVFGILVHIGALIDERRTDPAAALSPGDTAAIVSLVIAVIAIGVARLPQRSGIAALLLAIAAALEAVFSEGAREFVVGRPGWELIFHVAVATTAFALLTIGAALASAQVLVERRLRARQPLGWMRILTPIESLESGCFQAIVGGFALLTLALLSGALFIEDLFAQHLVHKVVLAIIAWAVFGTLLLGRWRFGWRGRQAMRWTLTGYALLGLAYFGSKFVLENLLGRHWG